jgi:hypothetical protein
MDRAELQRRAAIIRDRIVNNYSWEKQSRVIVEFLTRLVEKSAFPIIPGNAPGVTGPSPRRDLSRAAGGTI